MTAPKCIHCSPLHALIAEQKAVIEALQEELEQAYRRIRPADDGNEFEVTECGGSA